VPTRSIHTSCPRCGKPFAIVWRRETARRDRKVIQCPRVVDRLRCPGTVEAVVPREARAVASPDPPV
jgi:hypothetical protein